MSRNLSFKESVSFIKTKQILIFLFIHFLFIVEVIDPPLNIYCYLEDKMYVKVPMTLRITIKNPSRFVVRLKTCLKNSENFMFSGNTQVKRTSVIFFKSTLMPFSISVEYFHLFICLVRSVVQFVSIKSWLARFARIRD